MPNNSGWINALISEEAISQVVKICGDRINNGGFWWQASRNHNDTEVYSCRHAIKYRERLGSGDNGGIPLWAELKSLIGYVIESSTNSRILFSAHTRANTEFIDSLIIDALGLDCKTAQISIFIDTGTITDSIEAIQGSTASESIRFSENEWFGKVNPFNVDLIFKQCLKVDVEIQDIWQIFDESLELNGGFPNTVMSNLGDRKLAFELHPADLINIIKQLSPKVVVRKIAQPCPIWLGEKGNPVKNYWSQFPPPTGPKIGILTGNSPESGLTLWEDILNYFRSLYTNLADVLMPEIIIHSCPQMGLTMELVGRDEHIWQEIKHAILGLLKAGCKLVTVACNTTIYYEPRIIKLCEDYHAKFISIAEACMPAIKQALSSREKGSGVGLVGIGPVVDMVGPYSGYKRYLEAEGIEVIPCPGERLAFAVKNTGTKQSLVTEFRRLISQQLPKERVIVLALTEVSMVYREHIATKKKNQDTERVFIDPLLELSKYISLLYLTHGYKEAAVCQIPSDFKIEEKLIQKLA